MQTSSIMTAIGDGKGILTFRQHQFPVAIGANGTRSDKSEGDSATPPGLLPLRRVFYRADRLARPRTSLPCEPLAPHDGWCDDPRHRDYNRFVTLPHDARCENLWRDDHSYDLIAVLGWNDDPPVPGRGSAIFLHLPTTSGVTEGCIALPEAQWRTLLADGMAAIEVSPAT